MPTTLKFTVTQDDINDAEHYRRQRARGFPYYRKPRCATCAVALAIARRFPNTQLEVGIFYVFVDGVKLIQLPTVASDFIWDADSGREVQPIEFEANLL